MIEVEHDHITLDDLMYLQHIMQECGLEVSNLFYSLNNHSDVIQAATFVFEFYGDKNIKLALKIERYKAFILHVVENSKNGSHVLSQLVWPTHEACQIITCSNDLKCASRGSSNVSLEYDTFKNIKRMLS